MTRRPAKGRDSGATDPRATPELSAREITAPASLVQTLEEVQALLSAAVPDGDVAELVERGLKLLKADALKRRFGATLGGTAACRLGGRTALGAAGGRSRRASKRTGGHDSDASGEPKAASTERAETAGDVSPGTVPGAPKQRSRYIPAHVRSAVWSRDRGRCSYVAPAAIVALHEMVHTGAELREAAQVLALLGLVEPPRPLERLVGMPVESGVEEADAPLEGFGRVELVEDHAAEHLRRVGPPRGAHQAQDKRRARRARSAEPDLAGGSTPGRARQCFTWARGRCRSGEVGLDTRPPPSGAEIAFRGSAGRRAIRLSWAYGYRSRMWARDASTSSRSTARSTFASRVR